MIVYVNIINKSKHLAPLFYFLGLLSPGFLLFYKLSVNLDPDFNSSQSIRKPFKYGTTENKA